MSSEMSMVSREQLNHHQWRKVVKPCETPWRTHVEKKYTRHLPRFVFFLTGKNILQTECAGAPLGALSGPKNGTFSHDSLWIPIVIGYVWKTTSYMEVKSYMY